ncbi:MAG: HAMP domain-containing sensor histidine kinase [Hymenobacter sp.]
MKIRTKLALQFTLLVALLLVVGLGITYYLAEQYALQQFEQRLQDRAYTAAALYLEADEQPNNITERVRQHFMRRLPHEVIGIYDAAGQPSFQTSAGVFSPALIARVRAKHLLTLRRGEQQTVGIYYRDNQGDFSILVSATNYNGFQRLAYLRLVMIGVLLGSIAVSFGLGSLFARSALAPVSDLLHHAQQIGASDLHWRIPVGPSGDELAELANTFNHMIQRLQGAFEQQQSFVAHASHELRTPLTVLIGEIQILLARPRPAEAYRDALDSALEEANKLKGIVNRLLQLAQLDANETMLPVGGEVRLDEVLYEACEEVMAVRPGAQVSARVDDLPTDAAHLLIPGDRNLFRLALTNLIDNACKFSENKPVVCGLEYHGGCVMLSIADKGVGIASQELDYVRQSFFRASNARGFPGFGVGLALAAKIIALHGGRLEIDSVLHQGTTMRIRLPAPA